MPEEDIKKINTIDWWLAETPGNYQLLFYPARGFSKITKYSPGLDFWKIFLMIDNNYAYQFIDVNDSINFTKYLIENEKKQSGFVDEKIKIFEEKVTRINEIAREIDEGLNILNNDQLFSLTKKYFDVISEAWGASLILEGGGEYFKQILIPEIEKNHPNVSNQELLNDISIITIPEKISFIRSEQVNLLKIALMFLDAGIDAQITESELREHHSKVFNELEKHQQKFYWIKNTYLDSFVLTGEYFLEQVKDIVLNQERKMIELEIKHALDVDSLLKTKKEIIDKLNLSEELKKELKLLSVFGWWQDNRKKMNLISGHYITILIKEIAKRMGVDYKIAYNLFPEEIENFLLKNERIDASELEKRNGLFVFLAGGDGQFEVVQGVMAEKYKKALFDTINKSNFKEGIEDITEFRGMVACTGNCDKISGNVRVILNPEGEVLEDGEILVTSMTRPEFVPLMKKAKAVITNEGGITSHAAIVSRELKIPCIIGTKIATKVLKNKDQVEINTDSGIVKILN